MTHPEAEHVQRCLWAAAHEIVGVVLQFAAYRCDQNQPLREVGADVVPDDLLGIR